MLLKNQFIVIISFFYLYSSSHTLYAINIERVEREKRVEEKKDNKELDRTPKKLLLEIK